MTRYIDADALCRHLSDWQYGSMTDGKHDVEYGVIENVIEGIEKEPTVDAVPVRRGEWVEYPYCLCYEGALTEEDIACSSCGAVFNVIENCTETFKYCPNCGARMDAE